VGDP